MFRQIGPTEILLILGVVLLLFGGRKLPELARGSGRALRIFKSEIKSMDDEPDRDDAARDSRTLESRQDASSANDADAPAVTPEPEPTARRDSSSES